MADFKSKLPDLKELGAMTSKFFKDMSKSVCEIVDDYKAKRQAGDTAPEAEKVEPVEAKPAPKKRKSPKSE